MRTRFMISVMSALLFAGSLPAAGRAAELPSDVDAFRDHLEKWVAARQILSKERSEWRVEKEYLDASRRLLANEKQSLQREIEAFEQFDQGASEERRKLLVERGDYQRTTMRLAERLAGLEGMLLALVPQLPEPLQQKLEPLLVQIPEDPERTSTPIGQRVINVLGVLAQTEKFNSTATLVGETREVGDGPRVQVRTLYWGLGHGIYVDSQGEHAGIARPGNEGWEFADDPSLAADAKLLLDIYEGIVDTISFIPIPVSIK